MKASRDSTARLLRGLAGIEAIKGLLALAAACSLLGFVHHDVRQAAAALIGHVGGWTGGHDPGAALGEIGRWLDAERGPLLLGVAAYVTLRFTEAYGLWRARAWGERLGAVSGALYVPFEGEHLFHRPGVLTAAVLLANLAVVGFLVWRLRCRVLARRGHAAAEARAMGAGLRVSTAFRRRWPAGNRRRVR